VLLVVENVAWVMTNTPSTPFADVLGGGRLIAECAKAHILELFAADAVVGVEQEADVTVHAGAAGAQRELSGENMTVVKGRCIEACGGRA